MENNLDESGLEKLINRRRALRTARDYEPERHRQPDDEASPDYSEKYSTIPEVIKATVARFGERPALVYKNNGENSFITYSQLDENATAFAIALMNRLSVKKGDHIAMVMDNSPDWMIANLGIQYSGAADVPRAADTPSDTVKTIVEHSDAKIVLIDSLEQLPKLPENGENLDYIIIMDRDFKGSMDNILSFQDLLEWGIHNIANSNNKKKVGDRISEIKGDDLASIIYSSGTTGTPKGAMLTQGNYMNNIEQIPKGFDIDENDRLLSVLPIWHAYERQAEYAMLGLGASIFYGSIKTLMFDLNRAEHTILAVIPDILNVLYKATMKKISTESNPLE
ncbi:MAG: AMP-binding protein, partial [Candidatus Woesearchaeota archaeon]|nr:AMP-binding protein [Candidatus Woesearchaeota archaeon]